MLYSGIERQITSMKIKRETQESPIIISRKIDISAQQSKTTINNSIMNVRHINISLWNINSFLIIKKKNLIKIAGKNYMYTTFEGNSSYAIYRTTISNQQRKGMLASL